MILAIFVIAVAFGTESEFQMIPVLLRSAAYRTLVFCNIYLAPMNCLLICLLPADFFGAVTPHVPCRKEEYNEVH